MTVPGTGPWIVANLSTAELSGSSSIAGKASIEGLKEAYRKGCDVAILMDGDARFKTREIPGLVAPIQSGDADVVRELRYLESNGLTSVHQLITQESIHLSSSERYHQINGSALRDYCPEPGIDHAGLVLMEVPRDACSFCPHRCPARGGQQSIRARL
jgi:hypothetical protein